MQLFGERKQSFQIIALYPTSKCLKCLTVHLFTANTMWPSAASQYDGGVGGGAGVGVGGGES